MHQRQESAAGPAGRLPAARLRAWHGCPCPRRLLQTVRALELLGHPVEKDKYKALVEAAVRREQRGAGRPPPSAALLRRGWSSPPSGGDARGAAGQRKRERNEWLERFKFWVGLPNHYYSDDD